MSDPSLLAAPLQCGALPAFAGARAWLSRPLVRTVLTALAYLFWAQAGQLLALPPGYSSPVWPAAGFALAALLKWGPRNWLGVWLGAFLFNLGLNVSASGAAIAALIAAGSTLQALIGAWATRRLYTAPELNTRSWSLFASLLLRGPLVCVIAASVGIATLHGFGLVPRENLLHQWLVWGAGDVLGVLLFTPLFIWVWPDSRDAGVGRARRMAWPLLGAAALLTLGHLGVGRLEEQQQRADREAVVSAVFESAALPLGDEVDALLGVERFFAASDEVSAADFAAYTARIAARPDLLAVEWAPRVVHADRAEFERRLDAESPNAQRIVEFDAQFAPVLAGPAPEYFPVLFSEPRPANLRAIGVDYRFDAARSAARETARDRAEPVASTALRQARGSGVGHQVFVPVYRKGFDARQASVEARRSALRGYVVGLYDTEKLLAPLARLAGDQRLTLRITDVTAGVAPLLLLETARGNGAGMSSRVVRFANRDWRVELGPAASSAGYRPGPSVFAYLAASLAFALLVSFAFIGAAGRAEAGERDQRLREQMQAAQRDSELYLATTLNSIADAVIAADVQGRIARINRAAERLIGLSAALAAGRTLQNVFSVVDESTRQPIEIDTRQVASSGAVRELGRRALLLAQDGCEHPIVGNIAPIIDSDGVAQGVVLILRQVGEERAMLLELTESEARFRALTGLSTDWFWEQDAELRFVPIPGGQQHVDGIAREGHFGKTRWELPFTEIVGTDWASHKATLYAREPFHNLMLCRRLPEGERYVLVSGAPRFAADGSFAGYRGVSRNVTQEKRAELELIRARDVAESASSAKSAFLANMSHEIRTPMNGVIGMLDVLGSSTLSADQDDAIKIIRGSAFSLLALIDDILDFSKVEASHMELERVAVELAATVEGACRSLLAMAIGKNVLLSLFVDPRIPAAVWSDPTRLRQVLTNLVGNAIKFSGDRPEQKGRVSVNVEIVSNDPLRLSFAVADNGIGMSPEVVASLFTSFTQAEASTTRRFGGTGLGLAISGRLTQLMQGTIGVQSTPGAGSLFTVELPLEAVAGHAHPALDDLSGLECIVVEAAEIRADDLLAYLEHAGARVHRASDVEHAARLALGLDQAVVVRDVAADGRVADTMRAAFAACPHARHVLLRRGNRGRARTEGTNCVTIDADALTHAALVGSVAMAAGRRPSETYRPTAAETVAENRPTPPTVAQARAAGRLILVAEDDIINQKVILRQLALLGFAAEVAGDGVQALQLWRTGGHALLLSDLHMPNMDGYTLAQNIRAEEGPATRMPILALTANALKGEASRARAAGMDEYLSKPIQLHVLRSALETWMNARPPAAPPSAQSVPAATSVPRPVDISVLTGLVGDDREIVDEFLRDYLASARSLASAMRLARGVGDVRQIATIAHQLKSSARSIGALPLGDLCAELENAARAGTGEVIDRCALEFDTELTRVQDCLQALLQSDNTEPASPAVPQ